jgi:hypothetical protein
VGKPGSVGFTPASIDALVNQLRVNGRQQPADMFVSVRREWLTTNE